MSTLTTADLARARAYAQSLEDERGYVQGASWIRALADQAEAQERELDEVRAALSVARASNTRLATENEQMRIAMADVYGAVGRMLKEYMS